MPLKKTWEQRVNEGKMRQSDYGQNDQFLLCVCVCKVWNGDNKTIKNLENFTTQRVKLDICKYFLNICLGDQGI